MAARGTSYTDEELGYVVAGLAEGITLSELADDLHRSREGLLGKLKSLGISTAPARRSREQKRTAVLAKADQIRTGLTRDEVLARVLANRSRDRRASLVPLRRDTA